MTTTQPEAQAPATPKPAPKPARKAPAKKGESIDSPKDDSIRIIPVRGKSVAKDVEGATTAVEAVQTPWNKPATILLAGVKLPKGREVKIKHHKTGAGMGTWKTVAVPEGKITVWEVQAS